LPKACAGRNTACPSPARRWCSCPATSAWRVGFFPAIVPYAIDFRQAANADNALGLMLVGVAIMLPLILGYTAWVYWLFRGKVGGDEGYH
jgi:cytochrome bd-type quinol oxidase subunit 2